MIWKSLLRNKINQWFEIPSHVKLIWLRIYCLSLQEFGSIYFFSVNQKSCSRKNGPRCTLNSKNDFVTLILPHNSIKFSDGNRGSLKVYSICFSSCQVSRTQQGNSKVLLYTIFYWSKFPFNLFYSGMSRVVKSTTSNFSKHSLQKDIKRLSHLLKFF